MILKTKRFLSLILVLALFLGNLPTVYARDAGYATADNNNISVESTNSFGALLSQDVLHQEAEKAEHSGGYSVIDLTVEDGVATVEYDTLEEAYLVVSLYTEDGLQLLVSGNALVQPEDTEAVITLEGELPEYFMASAYLLDTYDYSPLCASYDTPMYTREMQELLASTTDDYNADRVLNLDDDKTTNFAVYAETTKVLEYAEGVNSVISANDETATYVIGNADSNITGLQTGDILAYAYGEEQILIVKVADISVDGTTATITGAELEMEEVFSHVKVESDGHAADLIADDSTADEGITFAGVMQEEARAYRLRAIEGNTWLSHCLQYDLSMEAKKETGDTQANVSLKGTLKLKISVNFSYYVSSSKQYIEFRTDANVALNVKVNGRYADTLNLGKLAYSPIPCVSIGFKPQLQVEFSGQIELNMSMDMAIGFSFDSKKGFQNIAKKPKFDTQLDTELTIYVGINFRPSVEVLGGFLVNATINAPVGGKLTATLTGTLSGELPQSENSLHTCTACVDIKIVFTAKLSANIQFLEIEKLTYKTGEKVYKLGEGHLYWSLDHGEFGSGTCPHLSYRTVLQIMDASGNPVADAEICTNANESWGKTNTNGILVKYLPSGSYSIQAKGAGIHIQKQFRVKEAGKIKITAAEVSAYPDILDMVDPEDVIENPGVIIAFGNYGENIVWELYSSGLLLLHGEGAMSSSKYPCEDYKTQITVVLIGEGITTIGDCAFDNCDSLTSAIIGSSVKEINFRAFADCDSLQSVVIPESVTYVGRLSFFGCDALTSATIEGSETTVAKQAFDGCSNLKTAILGDGITNIEAYAFRECSSLTKITIPDSVSTIGDCAFDNCDSLTSAIIGRSVKEINFRAFADCDSLQSVVIHESVTYV